MQLYEHDSSFSFLACTNEYGIPVFHVLMFELWRTELDLLNIKHLETNTSLAPVFYCCIYISYRYRLQSEIIPGPFKTMGELLYK